MTLLSKAAFLAKYATIFADNSSRNISEEDMRDFRQDIADSFVDESTATSPPLEDVLTEDNDAGALQIKNIADGTDPQDAVSKAQLDAAALGIVSSWKAPVKVATAVAGTLATSFENGDTVDGVALVTGDRILIKNQATQSENGIYTVNASGAPTRASDANAAAELEGVAVMVQQGTAGANTTWIQTTDGITLGSSNIVWSAMGTTVPDADATTKGIARLYPSTSLGTNTDGAPTQNAAKVYADALIVDSIADSDTTHAPSRNAVFDALAGKQASLGFTPENVSNKATSVSASSTQYPNNDAVIAYAAPIAVQDDTDYALILSYRNLFNY